MAKTRLYFAYGLNINPGIMAEKCPRALCLGPAQLPGHRLAFFGQSPVWDGGCENVCIAEGESVWGVLYELSMDQCESLDSFEDARMDGMGASFHCPVDVLKDGIKLSAVVYLKTTLGREQLPSCEALEKIKEGAESMGLPLEYRRKLEQQPSKPAGYAVPKPLLGFNPVSGSEGHCGSCG
jgi:gamma-glutamylcyclotransferase (GGCT)/AIG2-like uncharacterized protein YtfP